MPGLYKAGVEVEPQCRSRIDVVANSTWMMVGINDLDALSRPAPDIRMKRSPLSPSSASSLRLARRA